MPKFFNTAGPCRPDLHYMLPPERRLSGLDELIEQQQYFVLHAPRQTGKTTTIRAFCERLNAEGKYAALYVNVESAAVAGGDVERGMKTILSALKRHAAGQLAPELRPPFPPPEEVPEEMLVAALMAWVEQCPRPTVLFIDEIDALQDETLLSVLRQLRSGYVERPARFPQSVTLIGLRDVRDYKIRIRPESESLGTASPFNIITESLTLRNFTGEEVVELYQQHTAETGQPFAEEAVALAFDLTQGQPWLVNALACQLVKNVVPDPAMTIQAAHIEQAREILILRRDTHLDSLVDKLREERVRRIIEPILVGNLIPADVLNDDIAYVRDLGLVAPTSPLRIANPIYAEVIPRVLSAVVQDNIAEETAWYVRADGSLDLPALLRAFQSFYREHSEAWLSRFEFQEAGPHLMLMAFLQRIVNTGGTVQREFAIGSGRADVVVRWGEHVYVIELKIRTGDGTEAKGIAQLAKYLGRFVVDEGYLVLFDRRKEVGWDEKIFERTVEHEGKRIHVFGA
jgi:hypothetical protein